MTMTTKQYWSGHVAAVKAQAISTRAYAQRHGLALSTLYYWQHKLKLTAATQANSEQPAASGQRGKFVTLHVKAPDYAMRLNVAIRPEMAVERMDEKNVVVVFIHEADTSQKPVYRKRLAVAP